MNAWVVFEIGFIVGDQNATRDDSMGRDEVIHRVALAVRYGGGQYTKAMRVVFAKRQHWHARNQALYCLVSPLPVLGRAAFNAMLRRIDERQLRGDAHGQRIAAFENSGQHPICT